MDSSTAKQQQLQQQRRTERGSNIFQKYHDHGNMHKWITANYY